MAKTQRPGHGGTGIPNTADTRLTEDQIHNLLRNERRRAVLRLTAASAETTIAVRDLAERIAAEETGEDPPPRNTRQSVYVSLIQTHLSTLDEAGVLEYDEQAKTVTDTPVMDQLVPYTSELTRTERLEETATDTDHRASLLGPALVVVAASWLAATGAALDVSGIASVSPLF